MGGRWLGAVGLPLAPFLALSVTSIEHLFFQTGSAAGHWCIHDLFRALGALSSLMGA